MVKKVTPEQRARRKEIRAFRESLGITDISEIKELFKEMVGDALEHAFHSLSRNLFIRLACNLNTNI